MTHCLLPPSILILERKQPVIGGLDPIALSFFVQGRGPGATDTTPLLIIIIIATTSARK